MNRCDYTTSNIINGVKKITIDNGGKYIPKSEQTRDKDSKQNTIRTNSLPRKQGKGISENNKKFVKNMAAG